MICSVSFNARLARAKVRLCELVLHAVASRREHQDNPVRQALREWVTERRDDEIRAVTYSPCPRCGTVFSSTVEPGQCHGAAFASA